LSNASAPFLSCDPEYPQLLGARHSPLGRLAARLGALFLPAPLHARATLHIGAGGETDIFSRFTWALPSQQDLGFDQTPDLNAILPGAVVNAVYAPVESHSAARAR